MYFFFSFLYLVQQEGLTSSLYVAMAGIHQSASQYASVLLSAPPFSPQTYIEFLVCFENLYKHLQDHRESRASRSSLKWKRNSNTRSTINTDCFFQGFLCSVTFG